MVTNHLSALLQSLSSADIHTYRRIELQCPSTRCCLRVTEHNANLLTQSWLMKITTQLDLLITAVSFLRAWDINLA